MAVGVSGGKDSHAVAWALSRFLKDYEGPKLLVEVPSAAVVSYYEFDGMDDLYPESIWEKVVFNTHRPSSATGGARINL